jgi:NAD(P)-dependent dehydrogenase (short-subunit alcohol dehydrogenase family)
MSDSLPESLVPTAPGDAFELEARPLVAGIRGRGTRLTGRVAVVTDGASGLGQAIAVAFAREGANVVIAWLNEHESAAETVALIEAEGRPALSIPGDIGNADFAAELVRQAVAEFGRIDILVNNAGEQHECLTLEDIPEEQVERVFRTNVFAQFWLTKAALPHMADGACIINTSSAAAYAGGAALIDYAASKAAVVGFTRSLALQLAKRAIRVNAVAPSVQSRSEDLAETYVFLASPDSGTMTGQTLQFAPE